MRPHHHPTRTVARGTAAVLVAAACWSGSTREPALAAPPQDLPGTVTDLAGVLDPDEEDALGAVLGEIARTSPYRLHVVYVDDFGGWDERAWVDETATASALGRDDVLLAVAVDERRYQVRVEHDNALTDDELERVRQDGIEPALRDDDWAGAASAAASGFAETPDQEPARGGWLVLLQALLILGGAGLVLLSPVLVPLLIWWRRRRRRARRAAAHLADVEARAVQALADARATLDRATREHARAVEEFGPATVEPFTAALERARGRLARAPVPGPSPAGVVPATPEHRYAAAQAVAATCARVETSLRTQEGHAARLRSRYQRAPQDLADARRQARQLSDRAAAAERAWVVIRQQHPRAATLHVPGAIADAVSEIARAVEAVDAGTAALGGPRSVAVAHLETARAALARVVVGLDDLDQDAADLRTAPAAVLAVVAAIDADLADAGRLAPDDPAVLAAVGAARLAQVAARGAGSQDDPLTVLAGLRAAGRALDESLDGVRAAEAADRHAAERLPRALRDVDTLVDRARAAVDRGGDSVNQAARERLAQAEHRAAEGAALAGTDPVAAIRALRAAADHADDARARAVRNVHEARRRTAQAARLRTSPDSWGDPSGGGSSSGGSSDSRGGGGDF